MEKDAVAQAQVGLPDHKCPQLDHRYGSSGR